MMTICAFGAYIILSSLNDNIVFFYPPSEIDKIQPNTKARVGGLVKENSIIRISNKKILFTITDHKEDLQIEYEGILPALFREKQGIIAEGNLQTKNLFVASKLLAKHDENYKPPEIRHIENNAPK